MKTIGITHLFGQQNRGTVELPRTRYRNGKFTVLQSVEEPTHIRLEKVVGLSVTLELPKTRGEILALLREVCGSSGVHLLGLRLWSYLREQQDLVQYMRNMSISGDWFALIFDCELSSALDDRRHLLTYLRRNARDKNSWSPSPGYLSSKTNDYYVVLVP